MAATRTRKDTRTRKTVTGAENRRRMGEAEHEEIEVTLAHYLPEGNEFTGEEQTAGDKITVKRHQARHLIAAGYAAVDPEDQEQVAAALALAPGGDEPDEPAAE